MAAKRLGYQKRNEFLKTLGYKSYYEYLKSPLWKKIRARQLKKHPQCKFCNKPASQVHHKIYTELNLTGKSSGYLISICRPCHQKIETNEDGKKYSMGKSVRRTDYFHFMDDELMELFLNIVRNLTSYARTKKDRNYAYRLKKRIKKNSFPKDQKKLRKEILRLSKTLLSIKTHGDTRVIERARLKEIVEKELGPINV